VWSFWSIWIIQIPKVGIKVLRFLIVKIFKYQPINSLKGRRACRGKKNTDLMLTLF